MKTVLIAFTLLLSTFFLRAQEKPVQRIVLIGNAGDPAVLDAVKQQLLPDSNTTIIFLGNEDGIRNKEIVDRQLALLQGSTAKAIFVPGDGEWGHGKAYGYQAVQDAEQFFKAQTGNNIRFLPEGGCPGPVDVEIGEDIVLVAVNSQWWLQEHDKPGVESACPYRTDMQVIDELDDAVSDHRKKLVLFVSHHPFRSTGLRSGYFGMKQHIFPLTDIRGLKNAYVPLPLVGSLYAITRNLVVSRQDMAHAKYQEMISSIDNVLANHPYLIRIAGHEDILELYKENDQYYIVSGAGSGAGRAQRTPKTLYAAGKRGFTVLDVNQEKQVAVKFYEVKDGKVETGYAGTLFNFSKLPPLAPDTARLEMTNADSVVATVNKGYNEVTGFKKWMNGRNYREVWATPVKLKVLRLNEERGGLKIDGQGGGKQTISIRLKDSAGRSWSLRNINKDPEKVIPENFRHTFAQDMIHDILSSSHPYAAAPATALSRALNIAAPEVAFYFVPNDSALGYYQTFYANTVAMMEQRDPSLYGEETDNTWKVFNGRLDKEKVTIDQQSFLKARMLDVMIADFDRHYEQFKWGEREENGGKIYYAVPKDRDQAFFYSDGMVMKLFAYSRMPFLKGLRPDIPNMPWYGFVARDIDGLFLNQLERKDWEQTLTDFKTALPDAVITDAVKQMPREIYALHGEHVSWKLRGRRDAIAGAGMEYYEFLAKNVNVVGSNSDERFVVSKGDNGGTRVQVFQKVEASGEHLVYSRTFFDNETKEVRLYGLNGNDHFLIDQDVDSRIKFRVVGGNGADSFDMRGNARNVLYDAAAGNNQLLSRSKTTNMMSHRKDVNSYAFRENIYSSYTIPTFNIGYNPEDQFLFGLGATITKQGFRKHPFAAQHRITSLFSFVNQAYQVRYNGEMNDVVRHYDVTANLALVNPHLNNFFGFGNESRKDPAKPLSYYRVRYSSFSGDVAVRKRLLDNKFSISIGPAFYHYWNDPDRNQGRIFFDPEDGLDTTGVYTSKLYGGGRAAISFNSIDNELVPTRGVAWNTDFTALTALNQASLPLTRLQSDFTMFAPLSSNKRFVFALRAGGGHIFSEQFEYFQALTLGANNFLRGYRKNRFSGSSMAYASTELRMKLATIRAKVLPGDVGLIGFNDIGRVWMRGERSAKWHNAHGGGVYFTPFNLVMLSVMMGISEEETLTNISVGARLNITF